MWGGLWEERERLEMSQRRSGDWIDREMNLDDK
jgi:hypothetical protein